VLAAAAFGGGCGDRLGSADGENVLRGGLYYVGGPSSAHDSDHPESGVVRLLRDGHTVAVQTLASGQNYDFHVQRGRYTLSIDLGDFDCTRDVAVDRAVVRTDLVCQIK
jgi:hypothetical protein